MVFLVCSCASSQKKSTPDDLLFNSAYINQNDLVQAVEQFAEAYEYYTNSTIIKGAINYIKETNYNEMFVGRAKSHKDFLIFEKYQQKINNAQISKKIEAQKLNTISKESFDKYFSNLSSIDFIEQRIDLFERLIFNTFPHKRHSVFFSELAKSICHNLTQNELETLKERIKTQNYLITLKLNLYFFQNVKNKDIIELLKLHESVEFKYTRDFIEKIQVQTNKKFLDDLKQKLKSLDNTEPDTTLIGFL